MKLNDFQVIITKTGLKAIVGQSSRKTEPSSMYPEPNFNGTGMALIGVLKKDETLEQWIRRDRRVKK